MWWYLRSFFGREQENVFTINLGQYADRPTVVSIVILDASTSMDDYGRAPQDAVNRYLDTVRNDVSRRHVTGLVTFSDAFRIEIAPVDVRFVGKYTGYQANGNTLLWRSVKRVL